MNPRVRSRWLGLSLGILAADQATKVAVERFTEYGWSRTIISGFLELVHTRNRGIAFGLLSDTDAPWLQAMLILFSVSAAGVMAWLLLTGRGGGKRTSAGLALILGGALGNVLDRVVHGSVVDFILLYFRDFHWPAFNLADSAIVAGAGLVLLDLLTGHHELERAKV
jgi:signal peptidase II